MNKRLEATINGRVQGVSFRYHVQQVANELHLTGWVANQRDGGVRVVAEGPEAALVSLENFLQHGAPPARVDRLETVWTTATGEFTRFAIRWL